MYHQKFSIIATGYGIYLNAEVWGRDGRGSSHQISQVKNTKANTHQNRIKLKPLKDIKSNLVWMVVLVISTQYALTSQVYI